MELTNYPYKYTIKLGDPYNIKGVSWDVVYLESNLPSSEFKKAFMQSNRNLFDLIGADPCGEYRETEFSEDVKSKLIALGIDWGKVDFRENDYKIGFTNLLTQFAQLSNKDLDIQIMNDPETVDLFGGNAAFAYGLFS